MTRQLDPTFVGREAELTPLLAVLDRSARTTAAVVQGEPGMGKTTLLGVLVQIAIDDTRTRVRADAARELQQEVPYAVIADLFGLRVDEADPLRSSLARIISGEDADAGDTFDPYARVLAVTQGVFDVLSHEGDDVTNVLVIDDMQWADRPSLMVLDRLLRRGAQLNARFVFAARPSARAEVAAIAERVRSSGGPVIVLQPLTEPQAALLLEHVLGAPAGPNLTALARGAAGNPLYLAELGRSASATSEPQRGGTLVDLPDAEAPSSFRATILNRLRALPRDTISALQVGAILGSELDVAVVGALTDTDPVSALDALRPALVAGLVVDRGESLRFRHDLVREALYQDIPATARREMHRRAAAAVSERDAVAAHLLAGGPPYTDDDLLDLIAAGEAALRVDGEHAAALFAVALPHLPPGSEEHVRLRARHAHALVAAGELEAATRALASLERDGFGAELTVSVAMLEAQGARDQADPDLIAHLHARAETVDDDRERLDLLGVVAYHAARADPMRFGDLIMNLPEDRSHLPVDARIHFGLARALHVGQHGDVMRAAALAQEATHLTADERTSPQAAVRAGLVLGIFGADMEPFREEATAALSEAARRAEDSQQTAAIPITHALLANAHWSVGDWDGAEAEYRVCAIAAEEADVPRWRAEAHFQLANIAADRGDVEEAREHVRALRRIDPTGADDIGQAGRVILTRRALEGRIAYGGGRDTQAIAAWLADVQDPTTSPLTKAICAMDLTSAALAGGDRDSLESAYEGMRRIEGDGPPVGMMRTMVRAAVQGDLPDATSVAEQARAAPLYGFGKCAEVAGLLARDLGDHDAAVTWLREALGAWERCGARAPQRRVAAWLRDLGVHTRGRIGPRPATGWEGLSDAQQQVVAEVAKGLLYREIGERLHISRRTVEGHVASALRKLDLRNRSELAAAYWQRKRADRPS